jgi:hypothetical protein
MPFFSPAAAWNIPAGGLPTATADTNAGLDSATLVTRLLSVNPYFKLTVDSYTFPVFEATASTPLATLAIRDVAGGSVPQGTRIPWDPAWVPSGGQWDGDRDKDAQAIVLVPATGQEYDLWQARYRADAGVLRCTHAHQGVDSYVTGFGVRPRARSVGLQYLAMTLLARELAGPDDIRHALAVGIPNQHSSLSYPPANGTDGGGYWGSPAGVPAGTRFALLAADAEIEAFVARYPAALPGTYRDAGRKLLRCLRDYGFVVTDNAGSAHFWLEDRNSGAAAYDAAGLGPLIVRGVPYPNRLLQGLFTTDNLRALAPYP